MSSSDEPDLYRQLGRKGLQVASELRRRGVESVAKSVDCGKVSYADFVYKDGGSSSKAELPLRLWVDCVDPVRRFYVTQASLKQPALSQEQEGGKLAGQVVDLCKEQLTKAPGAKLPIEVEPSTVKTDQSSATGNWGVKFEFSSGGTSHNADCVVTAEGKVEVSSDPM